MSDELKLFSRCPVWLLGPDPCSDPECGLRADHPGLWHARVSIAGTITAIWPAVELTPQRVAALRELLAASAALVEAAETAEAVASTVCATHADDPVLTRLTGTFLRRLPRWDHLPVLVSQSPGRVWRELLEDAARSLRNERTTRKGAH